MSDIDRLKERLYCALSSDAPLDRLTQHTNILETGRYIPLRFGHPLWDWQTEAQFVGDCLAWAEDAALYSKDQDKQLFACLLDKCARIAAEYILESEEN